MNDNQKPHKRLDAWKLSFELVKDLYTITGRFPNEEKFGIVSQIRRAAVSVPVNIAEGAARNTKKEFVNFLHISLGSLSELDTLMLLSKELGFITESELQPLILKMDSISRLITGLIKKLKSDIESGK